MTYFYRLSKVPLRINAIDVSMRPVPIDVMSVTEALCMAYITFDQAWQGIDSVSGVGHQAEWAHQERLRSKTNSAFGGYSMTVSSSDFVLNLAGIYDSRAGTFSPEAPSVNLPGISRSAEISTRFTPD